MKYYIIAGEASGDLHGANLMKAIKLKDHDADFRFWGGDLMKEHSSNIAMHYQDIAFMGFWEVITNLDKILKNIKFCKNDIQAYQPQAIIFIDYPGFNMRIAKWAKAKKYITHYYISPQIWAWKENRIKAIKRDIDHLYVILPFEKAFYEHKHQYKVDFVGHPLIDAIQTYDFQDEKEFKEANNLLNKPIVALLPGSRKQEIHKMLSIMMQMATEYKAYQFVIAGAPGMSRADYEPFLKKQNMLLVENKTYNLLKISRAALVTSGTATLETALFEVPQVVCYKGNYLSYLIAKQIIKLKYISLVNLIMDEEVVTELIQNEFNTNRLKQELQKILNDTNAQRIRQKYLALKEKLGGKGASERTADLIVKNTHLKM
ncbi:MAG: lipid-A-disaccharide synthase [Psychroflexus sp.]|jgi:lipid-A-disaccharide synthase|nr:lipid-A-disaccharide synthase [Psychroflexus sp.]MDR9449033.1 lipid-A-disaccharide synthase [Psychroflexus sp.]